ncbi:IPT/TIG domain-containing protein [Embleya sp. NBC_00896]|uniref:IPT/TIG domain-containing protein n=1 Tax=Embleya sp. NBC_00896 TaxID=2975961 RepID=UPI002F9143AF|nr:IPT/TIG domain-containing protein [Embleya sp. NBC_00896]
MNHPEFQQTVGQEAVLAAPVISVLSPAQGSAAGGNTATLSGSGFTGTTAVKFGTTSATSFTVVSATQITAVVPAGTPGPVSVTVTTPSGTSNGITYTYVPFVSAVSPAQGPASGGNTVTLSGTGFTGTSAVKFGTTSATSFTVVSAVQITAVVPAGALGPVAVTVTTPNGTSNGITYTYAGAPVVTVLAPAQGPASGGNTVTLTGTGFAGTSAVKFGTTSATSFTVVSGTQITAVVPAGTPGPVAVTVTTLSGTSAPNIFYFYVSAPVVIGVDPAQGPISGGNTVTLSGTGFTGTSAVKFGTTSATSFTVVSATQITAVVPAGTGTVQVTVTTPGGTGNDFPYVYVLVPVLSALSPAQGPTSAGNIVTVTGANLTLAGAVRFGVTLAAFTVVSDTGLVAIAPAGPAGSVNVTVETPGGTSTGQTYTRVLPPSV